MRFIYISREIINKENKNMSNMTYYSLIFWFFWHFYEIKVVKLLTDRGSTAHHINVLIPLWTGIRHTFALNKDFPILLYYNNQMARHILGNT